MNTQKQTGFITLATVGVLMFAAGLTSLYVAKSGVLEQKIYANTYQTKQAELAAQAGLQYGLVYLNQNRNQIVQDTNADGYIEPYQNSNVKDVKLKNNSTFTITYSNPEANNFEIINLSITAKSPDGQRTRSMSETLKFQPTLAHVPKAGISSHGSTTLQNNASIINPNNATTVFSGKSLKIKNLAFTLNNLGQFSNLLVTGQDVKQNQKDLRKAKDDELFFDLFGSQPENIYNLTNPANIIKEKFSESTNGLSGSLIWLSKPKGTIKLDNTIIGSATAPVIMIVDGNLKLQNNTIIYGFVYVMKNLNAAQDNSKVIGSLVTGGNFTAKNNSQVIYSNEVLDILQKQNGEYAVINNTWRDW